MVQVIIPAEGDWEQDNVTISVDEYITLLAESKFLKYLETLGIENWDGYQDALHQWRNDE